MAMHKIIANCRLCGQHRELVLSHLWPNFVYKRYVADQSMGGRFLDLRQKRLIGKQYKFRWLCADCDNVVLGSAAEKEGARICSEIEKNPDAKQDYSPELLRFAAS